MALLTRPKPEVRKVIAERSDRLLLRNMAFPGVLHYLLLTFIRGPILTDVREGTSRFPDQRPDGAEPVVLEEPVPDDIRRALDAAEFEPYFQPIVCLADGRVVGFEALARWRSAERGL